MAPDRPRSSGDRLSSPDDRSRDQADERVRDIGGDDAPNDDEFEDDADADDEEDEDADQEGTI